jgi:regulator of nonsense transcripts 2
MLVQSLAAPPRNTPPNPNAELQEKEVASRISRQRPILRVSAELALVGIIGSDTKSGGEWVMKLTKDLVCELQRNQPII